MTLRRAVAALLEWERPWPSWAPVPALASPIRRLALPSGLAVVGVGGATLGGSGRTPVAIALAAELALRGCRVVFVGHGYRSRSPLDCVTVAPTADVTAVGDEALLAARALDGRVPVVVGRTRALALGCAAKLGDVAVVDGLLQASPSRLAYALLALERGRPWGSGRVVPFGDLRAAPPSLLAAADESVAVGGAACEVSFSLSTPLPAGARVALISSMARPVRFAEAAVATGVSGLFHVKRDDHQPLARGEARSLRALAACHRLDAWCVDAKTGVLLGEASFEIGAPTMVLRQHLALSPELVDRVAAAVGSPAATTSVG